VEEISVTSEMRPGTSEVDIEEAEGDTSENGLESYDDENSSDELRRSLLVPNRFVHVSVCATSTCCDILYY
jgi:hypothetical protein